MLNPLLDRALSDWIDPVANTDIGVPVPNMGAPTPTIVPISASTPFAPIVYCETVSSPWLATYA